MSLGTAVGSDIEPGPSQATGPVVRPALAAKAKASIDGGDMSMVPIRTPVQKLLTFAASKRQRFFKIKIRDLPASGVEKTVSRAF